MQHKEKEERHLLASLSCTQSGHTCNSQTEALLCSFSRESSAFWSLSLWAFSSSSELKLFPYESHLGFTSMTRFSDTCAMSSFISPCRCQFSFFSPLHLSSQLTGGLLLLATRAFDQYIYPSAAATF